MIVLVWLSGENERLARAELAGAVARLGGTLTPSGMGEERTGRAYVQLAGRNDAVELSRRLALARRCAEPWPELAPPEVEQRLRRAGASGRSAAFQWVPGTRGARPGDALQRLGAAYRLGGGRISLEHPDQRYWLEATAGQDWRILEELGEVNRTSFAERRTSRLPFQRPVTLPPRFARALVNLARIGPGDRVVDPFVGTGSLLVEAALLGARTVGVDVDAAMIRGTLDNFAHLGRVPEALRQGDAAAAAEEFPPASFDALVTDPPYGRASGTRREPPERLWGRALSAWTDRVRPGGRIGVVVPAGGSLPPIDARLEIAIPQRVHRSLTREFRVYVRAGTAPSDQ